ncbi:AAA family ATPase [Ktedonobacteria bacterium brp13]|nr:AAA family ATPase [Ktedonobacteria bacterium brp13]
MQQVIFRLLGPPEISYNDQPIRIPRRRSRALLYYMVSTHTSQPRERLMTLLCGDMDEESARRAFKTMLAEVRSQLRSIDPSIDWIKSDEDRLTFNPLAPIWLDTEIFEKDTASLQRNSNQAIKLYRSDFLDGFFLKGAPDFDAWVQSTRDHFHNLYMMALQQMADVYEANHQLDEAITCMHMLLAADPLSEDAHARLMRLHWLVGDRTQALRQYERLGKMLAEEFSVQPMATTQALYQQIARSTDAHAVTSSIPPARIAPVHAAPTPIVPAMPHMPHMPLKTTVEVPLVDVALPYVGRARELDWLREHLIGHENEHSLLLVQGEMGMGKTRLLQEMLRCYCADWLVLRGTCQEAEGKNGYHPLVEALRSGLDREDIAHLELYPAWRAQLELLVPDLFSIGGAGSVVDTSTYDSVERTGASRSEATLLADALVALLNGLATSQRPLLLLLDDVHWCDVNTLGLLGYLARHVRRREVFLLSTYSPGGGEQRLAALRNNAMRLGVLSELALAPLSSADISELVALFGTPGTPSASSALDAQDSVPQYTATGLSLNDWCYRQSEGNPLYALAWLEAGWNRPETFVPEHIASQVSAQLDRLSRHARHLLILAACSQEAFDLALSGSLLGYTLATTLAASAELIEQRLIVAVPTPATSIYTLYTFAHRTARVSVLASMTAIERSLLQRAVQGTLDIGITV